MTAALIYVALFFLPLALLSWMGSKWKGSALALVFGASAFFAIVNALL